MSKKSFKVSKSLYLNPINLATITDPQDGELAIDINDSNKLKKYSTTSSTWVEVGSGGGGGGSTTLDGLTDVTISSVQDGQILVYNSATGQWENQTIVVEETVTEVTILNNQSTPVNTGITFLYPAVKSFELFGHIIRTTSTGEKSEAIKILGIYHTATSSWEITDTAVGNSGVVFSITAGGNLQYTSDNMPGVSYVGVFKYGYKANGGDKNFVSSMIVTEPDSYLRMTNITGLAGVLDFTNVTSMGDAISKVGNTYVINKSGIYDIGITVTMSGVDNRILITKNSTTTTNTDSAVLQWGSTHNTGGYEAKANWSGYLEKDSVIRFTSPATPSASNSNQMAYISYQGSTKILNPSSDQKVDIPTHELRFEGASSRGSTDTAIVKFDTLAKIKGDGFTVVNTAANGTVVTIKKAGKLNVSSSLRISTAGSVVQITKNQTTLTSISNTSSEIMAEQESYTINASVNASGEFEVQVNDIIRISASATPNTRVANSLTLSLQEQSVAVALQNVAPRWDDSDSAVALSGYAGKGSTYTQAVRFSNVITNLGTDITYANSATLGGTFTINKAGVYNISFSMDVTSVAAATIVAGMFKNLSSSVTAETQTNRLDYTTGYLAAGQNDSLKLSYNGYLEKNDVIYFLTPNAASISDRCYATISKVGKTQGTVDVTPFVNIPQNETQYAYISQVATFGQSNITGNLQLNTNTGIFKYDSTTGIYTALKKASLYISATFKAAAASYTLPTIYKNTTIIARAFTIANTNWIGSVSAPFEVESGDTFYVKNDTPQQTNEQTISILATASSSSIISQTDQVSSDTINFAFKTTAITDNDPVGTFNTFNYAAGTNTATINTTPPTQSISSMNVNGIQVFARAFNASSNANQPARVDIKIGKGLKSKEVLAYAAVNKATPINIDLLNKGTFVELYGTEIRYSEATGILSINAAEAGSAVTLRLVGMSDGYTGQSSGYFTFNASKAPSLVSIPSLRKRIAYLSDVRANGTAGGTNAAAVYNTRVLNTIVDSAGVVTSLTTNQFSLSAGRYMIQASAPAYTVGVHRTRIRNITDGTTAILGQSGYTNAGADNAMVLSTLAGEIVLTTTKTFELQHYTQSSVANNGFGRPTSSGESEVYSIVTIEKIE